MATPYQINLKRQREGHDSVSFQYLSITVRVTNKKGTEEDRITQ